SMLKRFPVLILIFAFIINIKCTSETEGERLAKQYCVSCHIFPDPGLLDKVSWQKSVLPEMAFRMGLNHERLFKIPYRDLEIVRTAIPDIPAVTTEEYKLIEEYFIN